MKLEESTIEEKTISPLTEFQLSAVKDAEEDLDKLRKEIESKKYLIDIEKGDIKYLQTFIEKDAKWKFTEALGIVEVKKELAAAAKEGKLFTKALAIEAIYYYMSKIEGSGDKPDGEAFPSITEYLRVLKGISVAVERIKADNNSLSSAEFVLAARREGIEPAITQEADSDVQGPDQAPIE